MIDGILGIDVCKNTQSYPSTSSLQHELRFEQPCTQDLRSCASQDTVQSEQRSLEKRGLIYRTGSFAKGTQEAHRSPRCSANLSIRSLLSAPRTEPYGPNSGIRLPPWVCDGKAFFVTACRMRARACDTLTRLCVRRVLC